MSKAGAGQTHRDAVRNLDEFGELLARYRAVLVKHGLNGSEIRALLIAAQHDFFAGALLDPQAMAEALLPHIRSGLAETARRNGETVEAGQSQ